MTVHSTEDFRQVCVDLLAEGCVQSYLDMCELRGMTAGMGDETLKIASGLKKAEEKLLEDDLEGSSSCYAELASSCIPKFAILLLERVINLTKDPHNLISSTVALADACGSAGQFHRARTSLENALVAQPNSEPLTRRLVQVLWSEARNAVSYDRIDLLEAALKHSLPYPDLLLESQYLIGSALGGERGKAELERHLEMVVSASSSDLQQEARARTALAVALGRSPEAVEQWERVLEISSDRTEATYHLSSIFYEDFMEEKEQRLKCLKDKMQEEPEGGELVFTDWTIAHPDPYDAASDPKLLRAIALAVEHYELVESKFEKLIDSLKELKAAGQVVPLELHKTIRDKEETLHSAGLIVGMTKAEAQLPRYYRAMRENDLKSLFNWKLYRIPFPN